MRSQVFWTNNKFPGRIALVPRPRGGDWLEDETAGWAAAGIDVVVSMLETEEVDSFELEREAELCESVGIDFISCPVTDRSVPDLNQGFMSVVEKLRTFLLQGKNIGIHCRQSIGRAPLLAAILMTLFGVEPADAFRQLSVARGIEVPETAEQKAWLEKFVEESAMATH